jgi:hypothetical protein
MINGPADQVASTLKCCDGSTSPESTMRSEIVIRTSSHVPSGEAPNAHTVNTSCRFHKARQTVTASLAVDSHRHAK